MPEKFYYTGKKELTMAQYEELSSIDINKDYNLMDYPVTTITNAQMEFALTCNRLFPVGSSFTCADDGTYTKGIVYEIKLVDGAKAWVGVTNVLNVTMAEYEALTSIEANREYHITDYPVTFITNAQMEFALTCKRLFKAGEGFICSDTGTYTLGTSYMIAVDGEGVKSWVALTSAGGVEVIILHPTVENTPSDEPSTENDSNGGGSEDDPLEEDTFE